MYEVLNEKSILVELKMEFLMTMMTQTWKRLDESGQCLGFLKIFEFKRKICQIFDIRYELLWLSRISNLRFTIDKHLLTEFYWTNRNSFEILPRYHFPAVFVWEISFLFPSNTDKNDEKCWINF